MATRPKPATPQTQVMSAVSTKHPDYTDRLGEWQMMRDTLRGEQAVKTRGTHYLPMPSGFQAQSDDGVSMFNAYMARAKFPEIVEPTIMGMVGIIHRTETDVELPASMEDIWERATKDGLPLESLHRRITMELLTTGRYALLPDADTDGSDIPYLNGYGAETLINWDEKRTFYVLDESDLERFEFEWRKSERWRVLEMQNGVYVQRVYDRSGPMGEQIIPTGRGGKAVEFEECPLVVIGPRDLAVRPEAPPLRGVARAALAQYRLDADYRHQLFMSGQETFVTIGLDEDDAPEYLGSGVQINLPADADAKYVGPNGVGIEAHRTAIADEREAAVAHGARMFDSSESSQESGDAKRMRYAAQTATLATISMASSAGLEKALRYAAMMMGEDPTKIVVTPNLKFVDTKLAPQELKTLIDGWMAGAYSYETLYENLQKGEIASPERTHEEEKELVDAEMPDEPIDPVTGAPVKPAKPGEAPVKDKAATKGTVPT
jgi:hypothetical protein